MTDHREEPGMRSLERGLRVIKFFTHRTEPATIADVARGTGLDRAVVRRILATLERLDYVSNSRSGFLLQPSVLELGYAYLTSDPLPEIAETRLRRLSDNLEESCSLGVLQAGRVQYLSRVQYRRIAGPSLAVGTMAEPHLTSLGRVLLAELSQDDLDKLLPTLDFRAVTPHTITTIDELAEALIAIRNQGWSLTVEELELGLLALAVPIRDAHGRVIAAANVTSHTSRTTKEAFWERALGPLTEAASQIEVDVKRLRTR